MEEGYVPDEGQEMDCDNYYQFGSELNFEEGQDENNNESVSEPLSKKRKVDDCDKDDDKEKRTEVSRFKKLSDKLVKAEKVGDDIDEDLADAVNDLFARGMSEENFKKMLLDMCRPKNCVGLREVRTNTLIWKLLSDRAQGLDQRLRMVQMAVCKAGTILSRILSDVGDLEKEEVSDLGQSIIDKGMEAMGLLGHANVHVNWRRREIMRPEIDRDYGNLCSPNIAFSEWLFGDNVSNELKDIQAVNRVKTRIRGRGRGRGNFQFRCGRGRGFGRGFNPNFNPTGGFNSGWQKRGHSGSFGHRK
jgi:hypothetical protein